jgi:F-type H+-transporting ATPase subunit a
VNISAVLAAVEYGGDWSEGLADIGVLFNFPVIPGTENWGPQVPWGPFDHGIFAVNRVSLMLLTSAIMLIAFFAIALGSPKIVPGRLQAAAEGVIDFVRDGIALEIIGEEGRKYVPLLTGLFVFIFLNNLFKLMPFINFPPTGAHRRPAVPRLHRLARLHRLGHRRAGLLRLPQGDAGPAGAQGHPADPHPDRVHLEPDPAAPHADGPSVREHGRRPHPRGHHAHHDPRVPGLRTGAAARHLRARDLAGVFAFELFIIGLQAYIFTMLAAVYIGSSIHAAH